MRRIDADKIPYVKSEDGVLEDFVYRYDINALPTVEAAPVVHGRWVHPVPGDGESHCSACGTEAPWFLGYGYYEPDNCPYCGARMDLPEGDEAQNES